MRLTLALSLCAVAGPALADAPDDAFARAHYATGRIYFDAGHYADASREFLEAFRLSHRATLLYNVGVCFERLGDAGHATRYYDQYIALDPQATERTEMESALYRMSPHVGRLVVHSTAGAGVVVDGEAIGKAPTEPLPLTEGRHHVEVSLPDAAPASSDVEIQGGARLEVTLMPRPAADPAATATHSGAPLPPPFLVGSEPVLVAPPAVSATAPVAPVTAPGASEEAPRPSRTGLFIGLGVAAVVVVGAVITVGALVATRTDYASQAEAMCTTDCSFVTLK